MGHEGRSALSPSPLGETRPPPQARASIRPCTYGARLMSAWSGQRVENNLQTVIQNGMQSVLKRSSGASFGCRMASKAWSRHPGRVGPTGLPTPDGGRSRGEVEPQGRILPTCRESARARRLRGRGPAIGWGGGSACCQRRRAADPLKMAALCRSSQPRKNLPRCVHFEADFCVRCQGHRRNKRQNSDGSAGTMGGCYSNQIFDTKKKKPLQPRIPLHRGADYLQGRPSFVGGD